MNWLCVGTGDIVTKRAADALATADKSQLVGICGGRGRAQIIANEHNAPQVFSDLDEALAKTTADAVYIGTPVDRHCSEATASIRAGKHVLVEKLLKFLIYKIDRNLLKSIVFENFKSSNIQDSTEVCLLHSFIN